MGASVQSAAQGAGAELINVHRSPSTQFTGLLRVFTGLRIKNGLSLAEPVPELCNCWIGVAQIEVSCSRVRPYVCFSS